MTFPNVPPYPQELKDLLTPEGFERQFWALYGAADWKSRKACFEVPQDEFEHYFGYRKYSEYAAFCNLLSRNQKKNRKRLKASTN